MAVGCPVCDTRDTPDRAESGVTLVPMAGAPAVATIPESWSFRKNRC